MKHITVLLAGDHLLFAESLKQVLQQECEIIGIAHDGKEMLDMTQQYKPDVVVADLTMPQLNGIDATRMIRQRMRFAKTLFLTMHAEVPLLEEAFRAGASGFITKTSDYYDWLERSTSYPKADLHYTFARWGSDFSSHNNRSRGSPH